MSYWNDESTALFHSGDSSVSHWKIASIRPASVAVRSVLKADSIFHITREMLAIFDKGVWWNPVPTSSTGQLVTVFPEGMASFAKTAVSLSVSGAGRFTWAKAL